MPSWYQHPSSNHPKSSSFTTQTSQSRLLALRSPLQSPSSLFFALPHLIEEALLYLRYFDLKRCMRVSKSFKEVLKGEEFDGALFRMREDGRGQNITSKDINIEDLRIHPFLSLLSYRDGPTSSRYEFYPSAHTSVSLNQIEKLPDLIGGWDILSKESLTWPPTETLRWRKFGGISDEGNLTDGWKVLDFIAYCLGDWSCGIGHFCDDCLQDSEVHTRKEWTVLDNIDMVCHGVRWEFKRLHEADHNWFTKTLVLNLCCINYTEVVGKEYVKGDRTTAG